MRACTQGINVFYALTGQEEVQYKTFRRFGLSDKVLQLPTSDFRSDHLCVLTHFAALRHPTCAV